MKTRDFATKYIRFEDTSPVTGLFSISKYPFLKGPMDASDDIRVKRLTIYKASSCLGTVLGQIINCKRVACDVGDQIMVCQTDDDAVKFTKTRGKKWLESVPNCERLVASDKYSKTNDLWLFRHKFLIITGPSITAAQSDQVRYVQTDESHLEAYPPGRLVEFEKRMGARWDRQATHITTAANQGKEVDQFYYQGNQNEWHWRCQKCANLIWPLWEEDAKEIYNGEKVFHFSDGSEEVIAVCPHCQKTYADTSRERFSLQHTAAYIAKNPNAPIEFASFRWSALSAAHWMPWREMLMEYRAAISAWNLGDLKPYEDWEKKRLCKSYIAIPPKLGNGIGLNNYQLGSVWVTEQPQLRVCSFDVQDAPFHLWAQADVFDQSGDSRRLGFEKLTSWQQAREFQKQHGVKDFDTFCDAGHRMHEVFGRCEEWGWYALFADDADAFMHEITNPDDMHGPKIHVSRPYSPTNHEDAFAGKAVKRIKRYLSLPPGYCLSRRWSKYVIGGYLMALKGGNSRYYGIASDMMPEFTAQLNSYAYILERKKGSPVTKLVLKQVVTEDHAFSTASMNLVGAVIRKFFPLSEPKPIEIAA